MTNRFTLYILAFLCTTSMYTSTTHTKPFLIKLAKEAAIITASGVGCAALWAAQEIALHGKEEGLRQIKTKIGLVKAITYGVSKKTIELIKSKL